MSQTAAAVRRELRQHINKEKAAFYPKFFKAGKGEYGEGDRFLGVVPDQRKVAKKFRSLPRSQIAKLLADPWHECRLTGVFILVLQFEGADQPELADSGQLWRERIAVVACYPLIKNGEFRELKRLAKQFLSHEHDLIHKAVGWMLREMGNVDEQSLIKFLDQFAGKMPRTMLRYSIERLTKQQRAFYMAQ